MEFDFSVGEETQGKLTPGREPGELPTSEKRPIFEILDPTRSDGEKTQSSAEVVEKSLGVRRLGLRSPVARLHPESMHLGGGLLLLALGLMAGDASLMYVAEAWVLFAAMCCVRWDNVWARVGEWRS